MKTKSVTYSDNYNDGMPKLDYKWWVDTNKFWAKNKMSGFKPESFMERVKEKYLNNGEVTMEKALRDLEELKEIAEGKPKRDCSAADTAIFDYFRK